ncbi:MAG: hypothetical protein HY562_02520 [Ignavibacteriales bacterium]|nr:hypothetical protein [Ignavibacteriales bacterium]
MKSFVRISLAMFVVTFSVLSQQKARIPTPSEFLGFPLGADRQLADYRQIVAYFKALDNASDRVELQNMGVTTLGNDFIVAAISSEENLKNKKKYQEISRRTHDPRGLSEAETSALIKEGKVILLVTCNIHSTEIAASQMAMEWAHALATAEDEKTKRWLNEVILLLVPSLNPDGQIMVTEWYKKNLGTKYEGGRMPWLYHHYVGHDNNRDWYMLTQKETKAMNRVAYFEWFPHVWLDEHQMGAVGPRIFVPPYSNPVAATLHPIIWRVLDHIGTLMSWRLEQERKQGVIYGYSYDAYWPGGTKNTGWFKNVIGLLTEVASVRIATPIEISPTELESNRKGLYGYTQQINFPNPWPGGMWRLRDIIDYELTASSALLESNAVHREDILRATLMMVQDNIKSGNPAEYYRIAMDQRDPNAAARLAHLIRENGAGVSVTPDKKSFLIPTAQPYARFLQEHLGIQRYPKVRPSTGSNIIPPYDITAWSLPLMLGVAIDRVMLSENEKKSLRPIADSDWPQGSLENETAPVFAVSHASNNVTKLLNDLSKKKASVALSREAFSSGGRTFPAGTALIDNHAELNNLAKKYNLTLSGLSTRPQIASDKLREVRVGLYKPWAASMDEGWTRWVLEQYEFNLKNIENKDVKAGNLNSTYDAIVFPDVDREVILEGKPKREEGQMKYFEELPPEYAGGITKDGAKNLKDFVEKGGTLIAMASSADFVIDEFNIPVQNTLARATSEQFNCPGSILRVHVNPSHPVTYGLPHEVGAFQNERIAYQTSLHGGELSHNVLAWYPKDAEDILLSGWISGEERLARRTAAVALTYGRGKIVLLGFRVQHRAQTEGTFKFLFNAIHWAGLSESK